MAIAFARVSLHSRSKGHSAVAASAYRTASKLYDERTGTYYDYSNRRGCVFSEIMLPLGASLTFQNREFLWNEVERAENRINSQLCKDVVIALPKELSPIQHIELCRRFAQHYFVDKGLACDLAIHDDHDGNPHAHILVTLRRIEGNLFSKYKARDLNPKFAKGFIVEGDYWHEQWRTFQNEYFQDHDIDLTVDLNHIISERHSGRVRDKNSHYLGEENELIKNAREELALHDLDNLINQISLTNSVFTRRDIEKLLFKTIRSPVNSEAYLAVVERLLAHKDVISLGVNQQGLDCYTTRQQYRAEAKLLANVEQLQARSLHVFNTLVEPLLQKYSLNEEQKEAFSFITQGEGLSVLIGRPGVGKSYLLKPIKEYYEENDCRMIGASLSGKVAKALEADTGISSSTIASLRYRLNNQMLQLTQKDILVIDEAGMVDFANMAYLLNEANKAQCKVILVGDPDQLKPIQKGEIFRGIAEHTGYIELENIQRQKQAGDKQASLHLAKGQVKAALEHYVQQGSVHLARDEHQAQEQLITDWLASLKQSEIKDHVMLAFTCKAVLKLNEKARQGLQNKGLLDNKEHFYFSEGGNATISLSTGERILLRSNNKTLGVRNGDLATIIAINENEILAQLDSGEKLIIPKTYKHLEYGYALTVHKSQGMTVEKASVLIDSKYWDKNLSFVAMTRHRDKLSLYADKANHPNLKALYQTLSRAKTKDNVIDWPLDYAIRAGFDPNKLIGRAINSIADIGQKIKHSWNYLVHYEAYLRTQKTIANRIEREKQQQLAKEVADYFESKSLLKTGIQQFEKEAKTSGDDKFQSPVFESLYKKTVELNKKAYELVRTVKNQPNSAIINRLKEDSQRYERYQAIKAIAELPAHNKSNEELLAKALSIDLKKDYLHIVKLASQHNKKPVQLFQRIKALQKRPQEKTLQLQTNYHDLIDF